MVFCLLIIEFERIMVHTLVTGLEQVFVHKKTKTPDASLDAFPVEDNNTSNHKASWEMSAVLIHQPKHSYISVTIDRCRFHK